MSQTLDASVWPGLTLQTGRAYVLSYKTVDTSTLPFGVPDQTAFGQVIAQSPGVTLVSVNRGLFSSEISASIVWEGADLTIPRDAFPLRFEVPAEIAGSATVALDTITVGDMQSAAQAEAATARETAVVSAPSQTGAGVPNVGSILGGALLSPTLLILLAVLFVFTTAGQTLLTKAVK